MLVNYGMKQDDKLKKMLSAEAALKRSEALKRLTSADQVGLVAKKEQRDGTKAAGVQTTTDRIYMEKTAWLKDLDLPVRKAMPVVFIVYVVCMFLLWGTYSKK